MVEASTSRPDGSTASTAISPALTGGQLLGGHYQRTLCGRNLEIQNLLVGLAGAVD